MKTIKIAYYTSTVLLTLLMLMAAFMELSMHPEAVSTITGLGYPVYFITMIGVAKLLGIIGIWQNKIKFLREWAYAGFFIDFISAFTSHVANGQGIEKYAAALVAIILASVSYWSFKKIEANVNED